MGDLAGDVQFTQPRYNWVRRMNWTAAAKLLKLDVEDDV